MPSKARTVVGRREQSLLCDPGSELRLGGRRRKKGGGHNMEWKKNEEGVLRLILKVLKLPVRVVYQVYYCTEVCLEYCVNWLFLIVFVFRRRYAA